MGTKTNIGKSVHFCAGLPATNTEAGFEALTYTKVEHSVSAPQFGISHANVDAPDLESGWTQGIKGAGSGNDSELSFRIEGGALTTAQLALKAVADSADGFISIAVGRATGAGGAFATGDKVTYAQGYLHSYTENQITADSYEGFTVKFKQNASAIVATK